MSDPRPARPSPLDPPMLPFAIAGTVVWAGIGVGVRVVDGPTGWWHTSVAGFLLGLLGIALMALHDRNRRRRRQRAAAPLTPDR